MRIIPFFLSISSIAATGCFRIPSPATPPGSGGSTKSAVSKRWGIVQEAADLVPPEHGWDRVKSKELQADRAISNEFVSHSITYLREYDWSKVPLDPAQGGPMKPLLDLARAQGVKLAEGGFMPLDSRAYSFGDDSENREFIHISVKSQTRWGGGYGSGSGGYSVDINAQRIVYWRMYVVPDAGASLGARLEYDRVRQRLLVELSYNDRTVLKTDYPPGSATLVEEIEEK